MHLDTQWKPPKSPIGMLQEDMWPDAWKILVTCILHNQTSRKQVDKVYKVLFETYPTPEEMQVAELENLSTILKPLGFQNRRAVSLKRFSREFTDEDWKKASDLYGCGKYADDCYQVFCAGEWKKVKPTDHALNDYIDWLRERGETNA